MFFNPCENIMFICCTLMLTSHCQRKFNEFITNRFSVCVRLGLAHIPSSSLSPSIVIHRITILSHRKCNACQNFWAFHHRILCIDTTALTHSRNNHGKKIVEQKPVFFFLDRCWCLLLHLNEPICDSLFSATENNVHSFSRRTNGGMFADGNT